MTKASDAAQDKQVRHVAALSPPQDKQDKPQQRQQRLQTQRKEINDSEVRILTESEVQILASMGAAIPGFDDSEEAQGGNSLEDESNHDKSEQDRLPHDRSEETAQVTAMSDTTESTPDIFRSPVRQDVQISQRALEKEIVIEVEDTRQRQGFKYVGPPIISETEQQGNSSDSDDNIPVATLLSARRQ